MSKHTRTSKVGRPRKLIQFIFKYLYRSMEFTKRIKAETLEVAQEKLHEDCNVDSILNVTQKVNPKFNW